MYQEFIETIIKERPSKDTLNRLKNKLCIKYKVKKQPLNNDPKAVQV